MMLTTVKADLRSTVDGLPGRRLLGAYFGQGPALADEVRH
jgi:hypothetical protein